MTAQTPIQASTTKSEQLDIQLARIAADIELAVRNSLAEDIGSGDITAELIAADKTDHAEVITREDCIVCGRAWVEETFRQLDPSVKIEWLAKDGDHLIANSVIFRLRGLTRSLLTGERTALNFLQLLSGVATKAGEYAKLVSGTNIKILDTRKTIPGLRTAQKYAVACGGCHNHRVGLFDAFLIKENHILGCGGIKNAIIQARKNEPNKPVEVEVESLTEFEAALSAGADIIMLDNFSIEQLAQACAIPRGETKIELSGNVTADRVEAYRAFDIDFISTGDLTKNCMAVDLSMRVTSHS